MIKTLRITTIVAAVLAVIFFVLPVVFGGRSNEEIEQFLNSAGVVEKFNKAAGNKAKTSQDQTSPLLTQAEAYAKYLNPPPKPKISIPTTPQPDISQPKPRGPVTTKFTLVGTSFYESNPELSLAFIDEPGKGLRWVRQGNQVEHLIIKQVKDGLVVIQDGQRTFEIATQLKPERSLLEGSSPVSTTAGSQIRPKSTVTTSYQTPAATSTYTPQPLSPEQTAMIEKFMESMPADIEADKEDSTQIEKLFNELGAMRISDDEAEKLKDLPKELDTQQSTVIGTPDGEGLTEDPNQLKSQKVKRPTGFPTRRSRPRRNR